MRNEIKRVLIIEGEISIKVGKKNSKGIWFEATLVYRASARTGYKATEKPYFEKKKAKKSPKEYYSVCK